MYLVTGAGGNTGAAVVRNLATLGLPVRAMVRDRARGIPFSDHHVELAIGDLTDRRALDAAMTGIKRLVLISAGTPSQITAQEHAIAAARRAGVERIVKLSYFGAAPSAAWAVGRWHWEIERMLADSGMSSTIVRPQPFMQNLFAHVPELVSTHMLYGCQGNGATAMIDARDVAAVLATLVQQDEHNAQPITINGPDVLTYADIARELSFAMGRRITYVDCAHEHFVQSALAAGMQAWEARDQAALQTSAKNGLMTTVTDAVQRITGRAPRTFAAFANEFASAVRYATPPVAAASVELSPTSALPGSLTTGATAPITASPSSWRPAASTIG